jgi:NAD(P)-dependent dehydrogenase (short-subunit alcohol dehydrogenase family)
MTMSSIPQDPFDLRGHVSVVTGGASGIGLGVAVGLARAGSAVAIVGRSQQRLSAAEESLVATGSPIMTVVADVADEDAVTEAMATIRTRWGRLDSCFANAGIGGDVIPLLDTSLEAFRAVTRINLDGVFVTMREAARQMIHAGNGGSLVAISSIGAWQGMPRQHGYAASKAGITAIVNSIGVELARHGIRANTLEPGWIATDMIDSLTSSESFSARVIPRIPMRRWGDPLDLAGVAVYLASPASSYHSGDVLRVDGGYGRF